MLSFHKDPLSLHETFRTPNKFQCGSFIVSNLLHPRLTVTHFLDISKETESCVSMKTMSPTYTTSTTREFRLLDPVLASLNNDPTEKWFQHHSKLLNRLTNWQSWHARVVELMVPWCDSQCQFLTGYLSLDDNHDDDDDILLSHYTLIHSLLFLYFSLLRVFSSFYVVLLSFSLFLFLPFPFLSLFCCCYFFTTGHTYRVGRKL